MEPNTEKIFNTLIEAEAFKEGIEFVNDSTIEVIEIKKCNKKFVVLIYDESAESTEVIL